MIPLYAILVCLLLAAGSAYAQAAVSRAPFDFSALVGYAWMAVWSAVGGLVSFRQKVMSGKARWLNINELIGELFTSAFVGVTTGLILEWAGAPIGVAFGCAGVAGHAGGRALFWLENTAQKKAEAALGVTPESK